MAEETKPLILFDQDEDDSLESWLPSPRDHTIQYGRSDIHILPLPEGKTHHLFFSHSSVDQITVNHWAECLEKIHGISCFLPERDFKPGEPVIKNIEHGMSLCLKIVLVLTPDYVDSRWCDFERILAFTMSMEERRHCIIPVLLHPCNIPSELMRLNYIDVMKTPKMEEKIIEALKYKCELKNILPTFQADKGEEKNGTCLMASSEKSIQSRIKGSAWHFSGMTSFHKERLQNLNIKSNCLLLHQVNHQITDEQFSQLQRVLNKSFALKYNSMFHCGIALLLFCGNVCVLIMSILTAWVSLSQWIFRFKSDQLFDISATYGLCLQLFYFPIFFGVWKILKMKSLSSLKTEVRTLSVEWNSLTNSLIFISADFQPTLVFMVYNLEPCKERIRNRLIQLYDVANTTENERLTKATDVASHHVNSYLLMNHEAFEHWDKLEDSAIGRHNTLMKKKCVCEFVEHKLWGNVQ